MDNLIGQSNYMAHHDDTGPSTNLKSSTKTLSDNVLFALAGVVICHPWLLNVTRVSYNHRIKVMATQVSILKVVEASHCPPLLYLLVAGVESTRLHPPHSQTPQRDPQYMGIRGYINVLLNDYPSSPIVHVNSCFCILLCMVF